MCLFYEVYDSARLFLLRIFLVYLYQICSWSEECQGNGVCDNTMVTEVFLW